MSFPIGYKYTSDVTLKESVPIFLVRSLPKRDPTALYHLMLCLNKLGIKLPKDIYKLIYEELRILVLKATNTYYPPSSPKYTSISLDYDFVVLKTAKKGWIRLSDGNHFHYCLDAECTYLLYSSRIRELAVDVDCSQFTVEYWSFVDPWSDPGLSLFFLADGLNSSIGPKTLRYNGRTVRGDDGLLARLPLDKRYLSSIETCLKYGFICMDDDLTMNITPKGWIDHAGLAIVD